MKKASNITKYALNLYKHCPRCTNKLVLLKREFEEDKEYLKCTKCDFVK